MKYLFALGALLSLGLTSASVAMDKQINDDLGVNAVVHGFETPGTAMIWTRSPCYLLRTLIL